MTTRSLGLSQGMAAGFMIAVTLGEILPEALRGVTVWQCMIYFCVGAIAIYLLKHLLPEPDVDIFLGGNPSSGDGQGSTGNEAKRQPSLGWSGGGENLKRHRRLFFWAEARTHTKTHTHKIG